MAKIVIAGHLCLDLIPEIPAGISDLGAVLVPGTLTEVGRSVVATGGTVSNTGQALHRLGEEVALVAKVGNDEFGGTVRHLLQQAGEGLDQGAHPVAAAAALVERDGGREVRAREQFDQDLGELDVVFDDEDPRA